MLKIVSMRVMGDTIMLHRTIRYNFDKFINKLSKFYYTIHIVAKM